MSFFLEEEELEGLLEQEANEGNWWTSASGIASNSPSQFQPQYQHQQFQPEQLQIQYQPGQFQHHSQQQQFHPEQLQQQHINYQDDMVNSLAWGNVGNYLDSVEENIRNKEAENFQEEMEEETEDAELDAEENDFEIDEGGLRDSSDSDQSVRDESEMINWEALQSEFADFKEDLAIATGVGVRNKNRRQNKRKGKKTLERPAERRLNQMRQPILSDESKETLGRINFLYANQQTKEAEALCHSMIASDPSIADPWVTLGQIYFDWDDKDKALNCFLVGAFISKRDMFLWKQAGDIASELGKQDQAYFCFTQAINTEPRDKEALDKRLSVALESNKPMNILSTYKRILRVDPYNMGILRSLMTLAREHKKTERFQGYLDAALGYYLMKREVPPSFNFDDVDIATELAIKEGDYMKGIRRIYRAYEIIVKAEEEEWDEEDILLSDIVNVAIPLQHAPKLPLQLKIKLGVLLILLKFEREGKQFLSYLYGLPVADHIDTYYEVASIFALKDQHELALEVLGELEFRNPEIFGLDLLMAKARSHFNLGQEETAISLLRQAEDLDPNNPLPKSDLSIIYEQLGRDGLALEYYYKVRKIRQYKKYQLRTQRKHKDTPKSRAPRSIKLGGLFSSEYRFAGGELDVRDNNLVLGKGHFEYRLRTDNSDTVHKLFVRLSQVIGRHDQDSVKQYFALVFELYREFIRRRSEMSKLLPNLEYPLSLPHIEQQLPFSELRQTSMCKLPLFQWIVLFTHGAFTLASHDRSADAQQVLRNVEKTCALKPYSQPRIYLCLLTIALAEEAGDYAILSDTLRYMVSEVNTFFQGNMFTLYMAVMAQGRSKQAIFGGSANYRFFARALCRVSPKNKSAQAVSQYLMGHMNSSSHHFSRSLSFFFNALKLFPEDPAIFISIGISFLHSALQRITTNRHIQILQGFTFLLKYAKIKDFNQEARYNLGRAFHQISLFNMAIPHYEAALALSDASHKLVSEGRINSPGVIPPEQDLRFEAAYNISLIYHQIGSPGLADMYTQKYCVV